MTIEEAIQQKKFKSERTKLLINLLYTSSWLSCIQSRFFKEYDLTPQQYNVLRILRGQKGRAISVNEITRRMVDRTSNASRLVDKLVKKGLVERKQCDQDRRSVDIKVTQVGLEILSNLDSIQNQAHFEWIGISEDEARTVNDLLDKLRINSNDNIHTIQ
jgi:DNA-binding MarR family transcriptional regulator